MDDPLYKADVFQAKMFELSKSYKRDIDEVLDTAHRFAQAGYNVTDTISMTQDALLALNTAELNSEQSTQSLIGIMQQWGYNASEMITIIDKVNKTGDDYALSSQDLVDGLLRSSSAAKNMNISFDETIGLLTAMREATGRSGKEVGNALNSLMAYLTKPKSRNKRIG